MVFNGKKLAGATTHQNSVIAIRVDVVQAMDNQV
jgi:hypothetical protein